jgi:nitroreductase
LEGSSPDEFAPAEAAPISPTEMRSFLLTKRSCREFQDRPVERSILDDLIAVARMAPTAINCQERGFIIVDDRKKIADLRSALAKEARSMLGMIRLAGSKPTSFFLDPDTVTHMRHLRADFEVALRHAREGDDYILHDAPCLVFFTGIAMDPAGKDHALAAQHYFMLYAETLGLGTCINGYAQSFPKTLAKHVDVPKFHAIHGAVMVGYRKYAYKRTVSRKAALVIG